MMVNWKSDGNSIQTLIDDFERQNINEAQNIINLSSKENF